MKKSINIIFALFFITILSLLSVYSSGQNCEWAVKAGGSSGDSGSDITTDASGNVLISGDFEGTATFGTTKFKSYGSGDIFIAKYNNSGDCQWAIQAGGSDEDEGRGITTDAFGNVYITGLFNGTATFGSKTLTSERLSDVFVAK